MIYLLWIAGIPAFEFHGEAAGKACAYAAAIVEGSYHAAATCFPLIPV